MPTFDAVYSPTAFPDFSRLTPGAGMASTSQFWDPTGELENGSETLVDACFHNGFVHVAWVELDAGLNARGPFCSYWNGSSWVALGGEIEASLTPHSPFLPDNLDVLTVGSRYIPARVKIASDGASLYVAYSLHISEVAPFSPPTVTWAARRIVVSKWDGAAWSVFGEVSASTNNDEDTGAESGSNVNDANLFPVLLAASPAEVGVCYVTLWEGGWVPHLSLFAYNHGGNTHMHQVVMAKMDGATVTTKILAQTTSVCSPTGNPFGTPSSNVSLTVLDIINDVGTPWVLQGDSGPVEELFDWDTLAAAQTLPASVTPGDYFPQTSMITPDDAKDVYYTTNPLVGSPGYPFVNYLAELARDGSTTWRNLDGLTPIPIQDGTVVAGFFTRGQPETENIWMLINRPSDDFINPVSLWQYHRPCRSWTRALPSATDPDSSLGRSRLLLDGDTLYVAAMVHNSDDTMQPRLYDILICRGCFECGGPPTPGVPPTIEGAFRVGAEVDVSDSLDNPPGPTLYGHYRVA